MAAQNDDTPVSFLRATDTEIYFQDTDADLEEDAFMKKNFLHINWFKNCENFLTFKDEQLQASHQRENQFCLQFYRNSLTAKGAGIPVMLYIDKDGPNKVVVCCKDEHEVQPVEMEIPSKIGDNGHKAIFYRIQKFTSEYTFESSLHRSYYLGFNKGEGGQNKLVLLHKAEDEVDEGLVITLE